MKKLSLLLLPGMLITCASPLAASAVFQDTTKPASAAQTSVALLTNSDVVALHQAGLSTEIIIARIRSARCSFDISTQVLQELKTAGLHEAVMLEMIRATEQQIREERRFSTEREMTEKKAYTISAGTAIEIETEHPVSSKLMEEGDFISFRVISPVTVQGVTLIERDALATARVIKIQKRRSLGRGGQLAWVFEDVIAVDGKRIPLMAGKPGSVKGESYNEEVISELAVAAVTPTLIAATFFSKAYFNPALIPFAALSGIKRRGNDAVLPAGKRYRTFVSGETTVTVSKWQ